MYSKKYAPEFTHSWRRENDLYCSSCGVRERQKGMKKMYIPDIPDDPVIKQMERTGEYHDAYEDREKGYDQLRSYRYLNLGRHCKRSNKKGLHDGQS